MSACAVGPVAFDPISLPPPPPSSTTYLSAAQSRALPRRVAFSPDLGGICPVEEELAEAAAKAARWFEQQGCEVCQAHIAPKCDGISCF